jgi:hypothetical protein
VASSSAAHPGCIDAGAAPTPGLLLRAELIDARVQSSRAAKGFVLPRLQPGDAVRFDGTLLQRTHLTAKITQPRTSIESRYFRAAAVPQRVATERSAALGAGVEARPG